MCLSYALKVRICSTLVIAGFLLGSVPAQADPVVFSSAVATFHQTFGSVVFDPEQMIDGIFTGVNGWAIYRNSGSGDQTLSESALLTLQSPLSAGSRSLTFTIYQNYTGQHLLGDFSLGYTTDASPTLASADTLVSITNATSLNGVTFSFPTQGQLLVTNPSAAPDTDIYTIQASVDSSLPITGIFLNTINDPTNGLPTGGPGLEPTNGNFVVSEFVADSTVTATPEPGVSALLAGCASALLFGLRRRRKSLLSCDLSPAERR